MPQESRRLPLVDVALVVALVPVVVVPELVGGVHPVVALGAAVFELVALALVVADRVIAGAPFRLSYLAAPFAIGAVATIVEIFPLPRVIRHALQPVGTDNATWVTSLLSDEARARVHSALSVDPPETAFALMRLAGALALFFVIAEAARKPRHRALIYRALLVTGLLMFAVALVHNLLHIQGAWGHFVMKTAPFYAPMVNPNQLARVFGAISLACCARALMVRTRMELVWQIAGAVLCGAAVFLTLSRGAMLAFVAAGGVLAVLLWRERSEPESDHDEGGRKGIGNVGRSAVAGAALIGALALGLLLAREAIVREATSLETETAETSKLKLYRPALALLSDYGRVGVGNNAFGVAFMTHAEPRLFGGGLTFTHVENIVVATLVEHGVVVGGALLMVGLLIGLALFVALRSKSAFTPLPALAFLIVGDFFDFALESTAGIYVAAVLLGLAAAVLADEKHFRAVISARRAVLVPALVALCLLAAAPWAIGAWRNGLDDYIAAGRGDERETTIEHALAAHPADAHYCYLLAVEARSKRDPARALKWANRALVLWPTLRAAHIEAARALAAMKHVDQALGEYKEAFIDGAPDIQIIREIELRTKDIDKLRAALPDNADAAGLLALLLVDQGRVDDAQVVLDHAATNADATDYIKRRAVEVALMRRDADGAELRLAPLMTGARVPSELVDLALAVSEKKVGLDKAYDASGAWEKRVSDERGLLKWRLSAAERLGKLDDVGQLIDKLRRRAADAATVDWLDRREAALWGQRGDGGRQLRLLERAANHAPGDAALQIEVAQMELGLGLAPQAKATVRRALQASPTSTALLELSRKIDGVGERDRDQKMRARMEALPGPTPTPTPREK